MKRVYPIYLTLTCAEVLTRMSAGYARPFRL